MINAKLNVKSCNKLSVLSSQKFNKTCKTNLEIKKKTWKKKWILIVKMTAIKSQLGYFDASTWQYGGLIWMGKTTAKHDDGLYHTQS